MAESINASIECDRWNYESESLVINFHRNNRVLWDPKNPEYFNQQKRNAYLQTLAELLQNTVGIKMNVADIKKKWKNLRATFSREVKKSKSLPSGSGGFHTYYSKWSHFNEMTFLYDINCDESRDSLSVEPLNEYSLEEPVETPDIYESQTLESRPSTTSQVKEKQSKSDVLNTATDLMSQILNDRRSAQTKDYASCVGELVTNQLRCLPLIQQQYASIDIQKVLLTYIEKHNTDN